MTPENVSWLWEPYIPHSMASLLVGEPGLGKSQLTMHIAAQVTRGCLGDAPRDVIISSAEDSVSHVILPRLMAAGADLDRVHFVRAEREGVNVELTLPDDVNALGAGIAALLEQGIMPRLIIIDPITAHLSAKVDSHKDQSIRRALAPVFRLAEDIQATVLGVAHLNKSQAADIFRRVGGSVGMTGAARSILLMTRDPEREDDPSARVLVHAKCNVGMIGPTVRLNVESRDIESGDRVIETSRVVLGEAAPHLHTADVLAPAEEQSARSDAMAFLKRALRDGPRGVHELINEADANGISEAALKRAKKKLGVVSEKTGFDGAWQWRLHATIDVSGLLSRMATGPDASKGIEGDVTEK